MSDRLIPSDFEVNIPQTSDALAAWLSRKGLDAEICEIFQGNKVDGAMFCDLTDRDLKDLFESFKHRKQLREWADSLVSGEITDDVDASTEEQNKGGVVEDNLTESEPEVGDTEIPSRKRSSSTSAESTTGLSVLPKRKRLGQIEKTSHSDINSLQSSSATVDDTHEGLVSLTEKLKLVVPASVKECRRKGEALSSRARCDTIKSNLIILQATIGRDKPTQSEFELCSQKLVMLVPELKDPLPPIRQDAFKPWNTTLMLLKKAYYNRKPVEKPRKKKGPDSSLETDSTQDGHDDQVIKEMSKTKPDLKKLLSLLKVSFDHRRKWICKLQGKGTFKKVLERYPGFRSYPQIMLETSLITKCSQFQEAWLKLLPGIWEYNKGLPDIVKAYDDLDMDDLDDDEKTQTILFTLPRAWGLKEKFAHFIKETNNFEAFLKKLNGDCHLVCQDRDDEVQVFIVIENEVVVETNTYMKGLFSFVGVHHVFNLEFPQKLKLCFKFLEEYVFGMPQKKRTNPYRSGVTKLVS